MLVETEEEEKDKGKEGKGEGTKAKHQWLQVLIYFLEKKIDECLSHFFAFEMGYCIGKQNSI